MYISAITKLKCTKIEQMNRNNDTYTDTCVDGNISEKSTKLLNNLGVLNVDFKKINDCQMLSLILYLIEKNHHFNGDGIWDRDL